jgi:hypothetical protein
MVRENEVRPGELAIEAQHTSTPGSYSSGAFTRPGQGLDCLDGIPSLDLLLDLKPEPRALCPSHRLSRAISTLKAGAVNSTQAYIPR